jgi:circadian clock protein KaiC
MDLLLGGGLDRGSSALFVGPAGAGKTTLATKYAVAAIERSEHVSIFTFDEGMPSLLARAEALGMPLGGYLEQGKVKIDQVDPAELSPGEFACRVRAAVEKDNARLVVIDSLNGYMSAMPEEQFLILQMHELLTFLNQQGVVTILILSQQGVLGQFPAIVDLSYLADTIVLLRFFEANGEVRRAVSVVKKRSSDHEQAIREIDIGLPDVIRIGEPLRQFQGVLTGVPLYQGPANLLAQKPDAK